MKTEEKGLLKSSSAPTKGGKLGGFAFFFCLIQSILCLMARCKEGATGGGSPGCALLVGHREVQEAGLNGPQA